MPIILSGRQLGKKYGPRPLFKDITISIEDGERLGLIGANGSGKTTLLRLLAGEEKPDSGEVSRRRDVKLEYVAQEDRFVPGLTVDQTMDAALAPDRLERYEQAARKGAALTCVGFDRTDQLVENLSGGWRKRLAIAAAIARQPDLLLLDEPTNHLDLQTILWLETFLKTAPFALVLVSHDRYFLENVSTRVVELSQAYPDGSLSVNGTYTDFLLRKEEYMSAQAQRQHALEGQVKREVEWLRRGPPARTTKADARIDAAHRLIGELAEVKVRNSQDRAVGIDFTATNRRARELLVTREISKTLGGRTLFKGLDISLGPGAKLGLLGPNGSGKTTLLKIIAGELEPDAGTVKRADALRVVYFDQTRAPLNRNDPLRRALSPNGDTVIYRDSSMHVTAWARRFLFRAEQLDGAVSSLSGGEQARILLANLMLKPADLLILDEPTNDLDIPSMEVLEESLRDFPGAIVLVTHDRFLLDTVSNGLLALDGNGAAEYYADYAQWENARRPEPAAAPTRQKGGAPNKPVSAANARRLSTAEMRELEQMENTITAAEEDVVRLQEALSDPVIAADHKQLEQAWKALGEAQERAAALYVRWEALEQRRKA